MPPRFPRLGRGMWVLLLCLTCLVVGIHYELRTSSMQAWLFSRWAGEAGYSVERGPSDAVIYPRTGPFDQRVGYTRVEDFRGRLESRGFVTIEQARFSPALARLVRWGLSPPFRESVDAGLTLRDWRGAVLFDFARQRNRFERFEDIPQLVQRTLIFIEDRRLGEEGDVRRNPVIDWGRLAAAGSLYAGRQVGLDLPGGGGSTLATQMEKYRHSDLGRTASPLEKLRQMTSASLRVYREGPDTSEERKRIVLDYLNTVPLAAARGYGEVEGLGEGLRVWFGVNLEDVRFELGRAEVGDTKAAIYKQVVALLYAVRAPSRYLLRDREGLAAGVDAHLRLLASAGVIDRELADRALALPLVFPPVEPPVPPPVLADGKASAEIRRRLADLLGVRDRYTLDRLHVEAETTIDGGLQHQAATLFRQLADPDFVRANGLLGPRLLERGDPSRVVYSLLLLEATERGNLVRVHADSLRDPFDVNSDMKMELGSTAKLRTLVHYLDVVAELHASLTGSSRDALREIERDGRDPLSRWAATTLLRRDATDLETLLERALDRRYSASPHERFFTGGGLHTFRNFDPIDDGRVSTVREGAVNSTNLVFVRLMRDLVRYHEARLPYDARKILEDTSSTERRTMLEAIADEEGRRALRRAWLRFRDLPPGSAVPEMLGRHARSSRHLAIVYFAWHPGGDEAGLLEWLRRHGLAATAADARRLARAYGNPRLGLADHAWLADLDPLDLWSAGRLSVAPETTWEQLLADSETARQQASAWLFKTRHRRAQDSRLRTRIERDAFDYMTQYWWRLGFPFERMVPSYASAIGSSADRPAALADLMGILVNDGLRRPPTLIDEIRLAPDTPYHVALAAAASAGERVLPTEVARAARDVLVGVVEEGTARRVRGAFLAEDGTPLAVGGKTGSGDNTRGKFSGSGDRLGAEALSRTAAFVFFVGDRHYGVITASVDGPAAADYAFTSSLPLAVLRHLAPEIAARAAEPEAPPAVTPPGAAVAEVR